MRRCPSAAKAGTCCNSGRRGGRRLRNNSGSYQGIASAMPQVLGADAPLGAEPASLFPPSWPLKYLFLKDRRCGAATLVRAPLASSSLFPSSWPLKYLFLKDLAGNNRKNRPEIQANLLIYKYFTNKSLFLKDLANTNAKSLIPKDPIRGGSTPGSPRKGLNLLDLGNQFYLIASAAILSVTNASITSPALMSP